MKVILFLILLFLLIWANKIRIYLKWEKKKKRNVAPFYRWPAAVHQEPGQIVKINQARTECFTIRFQDTSKGIAQIKGGTDDEEIWCNLGMCQCAAYKADHKPCKHIYKIALNKGLIQ